MKTLEERIAQLEGMASCYGGEIGNALEIIYEFQQKNDLLQLESDKWRDLREKAFNQAFELAALNVELQEKVDLQELDIQAAQEIMGCKNQEIEELIKQRDVLAKQLTDSWDKEYNRNLKDEERCKKLDEIMNSLAERDRELIKALNYIRSCDNATQSAAKAIEMLKKYETI